MTWSGSCGSGSSSLLRLRTQADAEAGLEGRQAATNGGLGDVQHLRRGGEAGEPEKGEADFPGVAEDQVGDHLEAHGMATAARTDFRMSR